MGKNFVLLLCFTLMAGMLWAFPVRYDFEYIDFPGAGETFANDINNENVVVGVYGDLAGARYGFVYNYDGEPSVDDFKDVTMEKNNGEDYFYTNLYGNNDTGLVTGWYRDRGSYVQTAMVYDIDADVPVLKVETNFNTFLTFHDVNDDGWIVGNKSVGNYTAGVIRSLSNNLEYTVDFSSQHADIYLKAINDNGLIVGELREGNGDRYGVLMDFYSDLNQGQWHMKDYRDVIGRDHYEFVDINDDGIVLGWYRDDNFQNRPFLLDITSGKVFDILESQPDLFPDDIRYAYVTGLNNANYIVGWDYEEAAPHIYEYRGFLLSPVNQGPVSSPVVPEPTSAIAILMGLTALAIVERKRP